MRTGIYLLLLVGGSFGAIARSDHTRALRGWPPIVRRWGPAWGMVLGAAAYLVAEPPGLKNWGLVVVGMNAVAGVYVVVRSLVRSRSSNRAVDGTE